ncbi:MAG: Stp1/IreP family PP2C-type Ser/Thr phosphatase [Deltaproteobacteria bacterium]|nr:Stp1/IreP family PP2C-type Ser/Thr phosphatase [Deltaproteobacteria bacterium]MBW2343533.1 Stp1/IreP family PP2C-type Ser/Thr phosphatase [Deltaproteobacteria bacterium]
MEFVTIGSATHVGMKRQENQDYHAWHSPEDSSKKGILLALADGMGGRYGGATASKIAVDVLIETYYKDLSHSISESLEKAFQKANEEVVAKGHTDINLAGMASTLTAVVLKPDKMYYAHVGDSRGYSIYKNEITQFTEDHSYVADLIKAGQIEEKEAETHPERNIITRAIGLESKLRVDAPAEPQTIKKDQHILLCCDGLHGVVSNEEIMSAVYEYKEPDLICEKLVEKANELGGPDNITVMIARVDRIGLISRIMNLVR